MKWKELLVHNHILNWQFPSPMWYRMVEINAKMRVPRDFELFLHHFGNCVVSDLADGKSNPVELE